MTRYSIKPRQENMLKDIDYYYLPENIENNYWIRD